MFKKHEIIKHKNFRDVCLEVYEVQKGLEDYKIKGKWINQGFVESFYMEEGFAHIFVKFQDVSDWLFCTNPETNSCLRKCNWEKFNEMP